MVGAEVQDDRGNLTSYSGYSYNPPHTPLHMVVSIARLVWCYVCLCLKRWIDKMCHMTFVSFPSQFFFFFFFFYFF